MKKTIVLLSCMASFAACRSSNGPETPSLSAIIPQDGSTFTYAYSGTNPAVQLTEGVTLLDIANSEFSASRISDTVSGVSTTVVDTFLVLADGDLKEMSWCGCDTVPLPIATHTSYSGLGQSVPVKRDGYVGTGSIVTRSEYLGAETIIVAGEDLPCTKVTESDSISMIFLDRDSLNSITLRVHTYWYSATLGYFVKEQQQTSSNGDTLSLDWIRILTAYKLGK